MEIMYIGLVPFIMLGIVTIETKTAIYCCPNAWVAHTWRSQSGSATLLSGSIVKKWEKFKSNKDG